MKAHRKETKTRSLWLTLTALAAAWFSPLVGSTSAVDAGKYTLLTAVPAPKVLAAAQAFSEAYLVDNLIKPFRRERLRSEYASRGMGTRTFVDFDLGQPVRVAGFRHMQRQTTETISEASLLFSDSTDFTQPLATVKIKHVDEPGAITLVAFAPVTARYVRWQVTRILHEHSKNVGGKLIEFFAGGDAEPTPRAIGIETRMVHIIERKDGQFIQPLKVTLDYPYAEPLKAIVRVAGQEPRPMELTYGNHALEYIVPASDAERTLNVTIEAGGENIFARAITLKPSRKLTIYILPHSHTDIGYTAVQTDIEEKQVGNLLQGIAIARRTADYPPGARFVWNVEELWAAELYL